MRELTGTLTNAQKAYTLEPKIKVTFTNPTDTRYEYSQQYDADYDICGDEWLTQTFTPQTSHVLKVLKLYMHRLSYGTDFVVSLKNTDAAGEPTGADLISVVVPGLTPRQPPGGWIEVNLGVGHEVLQGTLYAIVIRSTENIPEQAIRWWAKTGGSVYPNGQGGTSSDGGETWTMYTGLDFAFEEWGEELAEVGVVEEDRIVDFPRQEETPDSQTAEIVFDNSDKYFNNIDLKGCRAFIQMGLVTASGSEYSALPPMTVISQDFSSSPNSLQCHVTMIGIPDLLAQDRASRDYFHHWSDTKTVKELITEIASGQPVPTELIEEQPIFNGFTNIDHNLHGVAQRLTIRRRTITALAFKLKKVGYPGGGTVIFRIRDVQTEEVLKSISYPISSIPYLADWCWVTLDEPLEVNQEVWIYCENVYGDASNYVAVATNSFGVKSGEWLVEIDPTEGPVDYSDRDCAYRYKYTAESDSGIDCFEHCRAYDVVYDSEDDLIDTYQPRDAFRIYEGQSRLDKINQLLNYTRCVKRIEADGKIHVFVPVTVWNCSKESLRPNAAGDEENIPVVHGDGSGSHYTVVDDAQPDEATSYVYAYTDNYVRDLYNISNHSAAGGVIDFVRVYARCSSGDATPSQDSLKIAIKTHGTVYESDAITLTQSDWLTYHSDWQENPYTSQPWTLGEIDSLQIGIALRKADVAGGTACTQVYCEVHYAEYDYEYSLEDADHKFFSKAVRHSLVIPNRVIVKSPREAEESYQGEAKDAESYAILPITASPIRTSLNSEAQANDIAAAMISKLQVASQRGAASVPMNLGAEVYDFVKVTDSRQDDYRIGNIGHIKRSYTPGKHYRMDFNFGLLPRMGFVGTRPSLMAEYSVKPEIVLREEAVLKWGMIKDWCDHVTSILDAKGEGWIAQYLTDLVERQESIIDSLEDVVEIIRWLEGQLMEGAFLQNIVEDTTPELGGDVNARNHSIKNLSGVYVQDRLKIPVGEDLYD